MTALTVTSQTHAAVTTLAYDQQGRLTHQQVQAAGDPAATTIDSVSSLDFTGANAARSAADDSSAIIYCAFSAGSLTSLGRTQARQRLPPSGDDGKILRKIRLSSRFGAAFLITVADTAIGNTEHVIRLSASTRSPFAALLLAPRLQLSDNRQHVVQPLVLDHFGSVY
jgi:YD repeat-containing protein